MTQHYPHRIRLRGPWEVITTQGKTHRTQMPARGEELPAEAGLRCVRKFGAPTNVDEFERVWLTFAGVETPITVRWGNEPLPMEWAADWCECDITGRIQPRNQIEITFADELGYGPIWEEVALEVRRQAYLAPLKFASNANGGTVVNVQIQGEFTEPLELYGIADGEHVWYQAVDPTSSVRDFSFEIVSPKTERIRVDLVQLSTIWYSWEIPVPGESN